MEIAPSAQTFRIVVAGLLPGTDIESAARSLTAHFAASPDQMKEVISRAPYRLRIGVTDAEAEKYRTVLTKAGIICLVQPEAEVLSIDLPPARATPKGLSHDEEEAVVIRRIADYQRLSGFMWIGIGIIQCLTIYGLIAGVWNIFAAISRLTIAKRIKRRECDVPKLFEGIGGLVVIGLVNLILGGVIGIVFIGFDVFVRDKVLSNRSLFNQPLPVKDKAAQPEISDEWLFKFDREVYGPTSRSWAIDAFRRGEWTRSTEVRQMPNGVWQDLRSSDLWRSCAAN